MSLSTEILDTQKIKSIDKETKKTTNILKEEMGKKRHTFTILEIFRTDYQELNPFMTEAIII